MRSKFWKSAAALMSVGILMTGCSAENGIMQEPEKPLERDSQFYINVAIASTGEQSTRTDFGDINDAGSYNVGTEVEQNIHNILFIFYNSSNKYVGNTVVKVNKDGNYYVDNDGNSDYNAENDEVVGSKNENYGTVDEAKSKALINLLVPVNVTAGDMRPAYVMAYVNPTLDGISEISDSETDNDDAGSSVDLRRSLEQSLGITRSLSQVVHSDATGGHKGFTMSNSVYYDKNDGSQRPRIAVRIPEGLLLTSQAVDDARKTNTIDALTQDKVIVIHVERVVAKVQLKKSDSPNTDWETDNILGHIEDENNKYVLNFNIIGWGLSNVEKGTFLVKNFRNASDGNLTTDDYKNYFKLTNMDQSKAQDELDESLPNWNYSPATTSTGNWITDGARSFWAFSPSYFNTAKSKYPSYSDEVKSKNSDNTFTDNSDDYALFYRSFNDIVSKSENGWVKGKYGVLFDETKPTSLYTLEHTMEKEVISDNNKRAVTCAVILGQYELTPVNSHEGETGDKYHTFFVQSGIKSDGSKGTWIFPTEETLKKRFLSTSSPSINNKIFKIVDGKEIALDWREMTDADKAYFEIVHPSKEVTGGKYIPNRFVSLQLKTKGSDGYSIDNAKFYLRKSDGQLYAIKTNPNTNAGDASILEANQALYQLITGIEKYHDGYAYFEVPIEHLWTQKDKMGDTNYSPKLGQYGVVRNHFYRIEIKGISGIGTGIGDPDSPIIPNVETEKYYVKTELRTLPWRMMSKQEVTLKP